MRILFNGQDREIGEQLTIAQFLAELKLAAKHVAVEVNREVVPRGLHGEHLLHAGDEVEIVTLVGGG
ncbi:MAG TPA: sulfur carrier protein ThiS [Pirellulaceae bacterium]|nr:sulfur carrier protein ThiS [Pirellulaceae bacterium]